MCKRRLVLLFACLYLTACGVIYQSVEGGITSLSKSQIIRQGRFGELTEQEVKWAEIAWLYVENNTQLKTGLVNSLDKYPTTSMSSLADYLVALMAARQFDLITSKEHDERLSLAINFLAEMPLTQMSVPNTIYASTTGKMIDYDMQENTVGWSSLDIGRLLVVLALTKQRNREFTEYIDKAVLRWNFCELVSEDGTLYGGSIEDGQLERFQEGRLGFEEYSAYGYVDWQIVPFKSMLIEPYDVATINNIDLLFDGRDPRHFNVLRPVMATPYLQLGMEFNWDNITDIRSPDSLHSNEVLADMAQAVYDVQESRWDVERIYTARAEHVVEDEPYFVYDSLYALGTPWVTMGEDGTVYDDLALVSTRAAFQMWSLWNTDYTDRLMVLVRELYDPDRGWYEGRYEKNSSYEKLITLQTNAGVLEALLYKANGKLYQRNHEKEYRDVQFNSRFNHPGRCHVETFR